MIDHPVLQELAKSQEECDVQMSEPVAGEPQPAESSTEITAEKPKSAEKKLPKWFKIGKN